MTNVSDEPTCPWEKLETSPDGTGVMRCLHPSKPGFCDYYDEESGFSYGDCPIYNLDNYSATVEEVRQYLDYTRPG